MRISILSFALRAREGLAWMSRRYASIAGYYPNRHMYDDRCFTGAIQLTNSGKFYMVHPVFQNIGIDVANMRLSYASSLLLVKLRPVREWQKLVDGESVSFEEYLSKSADKSETERLTPFLTEFPTISHLEEFPELHDFRAIADIICPLAMRRTYVFKRVRWCVVRKCNIEGEDITFLDAGYGNPLVRYKGNVDLSMLGANDRILCNGSEPITRKHVRPLKHMQVDLDNLLDAHSIKDEPFSARALKDVNKFVPKSIDDLTQRRRDLRDKCVFSIDPPTAKDLDDALSIEKLDNNLYEVGIHIADVSHYVRYKSHLCQEAGRRGNSFYLRDKVIHMLPKELSENHCSLTPNADKLAVSVLCVIDNEGKVVQKPWIGETIIRSSVQLSYDQSDEILDGDANVLNNLDIQPKYRQVVENSLKLLHSLSVKMRTDRFNAGAININNIKMSYVGLEGDNVPFIVFSHSSSGKSGKLIEEFMLLANTEVAKFLKEKCPKKGVFRMHPEPLEAKVRDLVDFLKDLKVVPKKDLADLTPMEMVSKIMEKLSKTESPSLLEEYRSLFSTKIITHMTQALYVFGEPMNKIRHYGLATDCYTHFTSPIRRFADIMVHYQLKWALGIEGYASPASPFLSKYINIANKKRMAARYLEWDLADFYMYCIAKSLNGEVYFRAYITSVNKTFATTFCPNTGHFGKIVFANQQDVIDYQKVHQRNGGGNFKVTFKSKKCDHNLELDIQTLRPYVFRLNHEVQVDMSMPGSIIIRPVCIKCRHASFFCSPSSLNAVPLLQKPQETDALEIESVAQ